MPETMKIKTVLVSLLLWTSSFLYEFNVSSSTSSTPAYVLAAYTLWEVVELRGWWIEEWTSDWSMNGMIPGNDEWRSCEGGSESGQWFPKNDEWKVLIFSVMMRFYRSWRISEFSFC